ncbi:MAG: tetratricopeptide repeat protein [Armatimonadetes bacterium]|nr:tetratricopeptide repeat protein [Armatimonadota bacterium]
MLIVVMAAGCVRSGQQITPSTPAVQRQETDAERVVREAKAKIMGVPSPPTTTDRHFFPYHHLEDAEEIWRDVVQEHSTLPRAWFALGRCQMRLGKYEAAVNSFEQTLNLAPGHAAAEAGQQRARELLQVAQTVQPQLPTGQQVIQLDELKVGKPKEWWLTLCGKVSEREFSDERFSDVHLNLYRETGQRLTRTWQYRLRGHAHSSGVLDMRFGDVQFYVLDLTADGVPEVVAGEVAYGASWAPSHLAVFTWRGGRLSKILGVSSSFPAWIEDVNGDGCYEIRNLYNIGWSMSHAEMPYWSDIYAYKRGRHVLANEDFPDEFEDWADKLQRVLEKHPDDWEILKYLGIVHEIEGRPGEALAAYRRAEKACRAEIEEPGRDAQSRAGLRCQLRDIQARIRKLR